MTIHVGPDWATLKAAGFTEMGAHFTPPSTPCPWSHNTDVYCVTCHDRRIQNKETAIIMHRRIANGA